MGFIKKILGELIQKWTNHGVPFGGATHTFQYTVSVFFSVNIVAMRPIIPSPRHVVNELACIKEIGQRTPHQLIDHPLFHVNRNGARLERLNGLITLTDGNFEWFGESRVDVAKKG